MGIERTLTGARLATSWSRFLTMPMMKGFLEKLKIALQKVEEVQIFG